MKTTVRLLTVALILLTLNSQVSTLFAQGTAFTYQGRLNNGASPANGSYDLTFMLFGASSGGSAVAGPLTNAATGVSNGLFSVTLDFGNQFPGTDRWLEIGVRTNGAGAFATLSPRQALTSTPYAIQSANAASASSVAATNVTGTIGDARLSANVALLNANQTFTGTNLFTGNIGIGTNNPQAPLHVAGSAPDNTGAILGVQTSGGLSGAGVYGRSLQGSGNGVYGEANVSGGGGSPTGVWGASSASDGVGVYASASANTGTPLAIFANAGTNGYAGYFQGRSYFSDKVGIGTTSPGRLLQLVHRFI